jgi:rhamnogalacturonyl hydrolase YesR
MTSADTKAPELLRRFEDRFDTLSASPIQPGLAFTRASNTSVSDGLRMAPPTLALLARATGDQRYLQLAHAAFRATYDALLDQQAKIVYCDARSVGLRMPSGQKVFWSPCSGSYYAGLALLLDALPVPYPKRDFYARVFRQMTDAVLAAQQPDGFWYPSLADPKHVSIGDTSAGSECRAGLRRLRATAPAFGSEIARAPSHLPVRPSSARIRMRRSPLPDP